MIKQVKNKILALKKVAGIELTFLSESTFLINCIMLEVEKGKAVITKTYYNLKTIGALKGEISENTPVALVINGKGVIHKRTGTISAGLPSDIFPGINPNDFLFQYFEGFDTPEIAVIRKNIVDKIIDDLAQIKINTVALSLAFYDISYIAELINHTGDIPTTQYNLSIHNNRIQDYKLNSSEEKEVIVKPEINVDTEYVKSNFIIPYASALKLLSHGIKNNSSIQVNSIIENQKKISQAALLKFYALSLLGFFLFLLLLNFFIYNHYFSKNNELLSKNQFSLLQKSRFDSLNKSLNSKKDFLANTGWMDDSRMISFYADRIAATVPDSVTLTNLNIYPAFSKLSNNTKQFTFQQDTILISGSCSDPSLLDAWIKEMSKIKNVQQSKINSYLFKKQGETGIFSAEVILK